MMSVSNTFSSPVTRIDFSSTDVCQIARSLLGQVLCTRIDDQMTSGIIVETEAYRAPDDKACHAYGNKRTPRTETMFGAPGTSYIYLCYGIHHLFNIVTGPVDTAHAVLIRAIEPLQGAETMMNRRQIAIASRRLTGGPGALSKALGISRDHNGSRLDNTSGPIWIEDQGIEVKEIIESQRVGVDYAEECALWPWRYRVASSKWTSPAK